MNASTRHGRWLSRVRRPASETNQRRFLLCEKSGFKKTKDKNNNYNKLDSIVTSLIKMFNANNLECFGHLAIIKL